MKKAIVAHSSTDVDLILCQIVDLIEIENFASSQIQYLIIPGYYYNHYDVEFKLRDFFALSKIFVPLKKKLLKIGDIAIDEKLECKYFAFDASNGKFVTKDISFDELHDYINQKNI